MIRGRTAPLRSPAPVCSTVPTKSSVEHIELYLEPDLQAHTLDGVCTTAVRAYDEPVARVELDAVDLVVSSVTRDGKPCPLPCAMTSSRSVSIRRLRRTSGQHSRCVSRDAPASRSFFVEPTAAYPAKIRHAWTQSQDENARYWFPALDYPAEKQTSQTTIAVPKGLFALGNGALMDRRDEGEKTIFTYRQDIPHSTYLMTMVAGPFVEARQADAGARNVPVYYYVLPGRETDGERAFGDTPRMIATFEEKIGTPYPYARYSQIAVSGLHLRRDGKYIGNDTNGSHAARCASAPRLLERPARFARACAPVVRRSAYLS